MFSEFPHALYYQIFDLKPGKGEERKIKILEAFIRQVATRGLEQISFETLGKAVKMKRTHIAYYYPNREELIRASVRFAVAVGQRMTIAEVEKARGWKDKLRAVVNGPLEWFHAYPEHVAVMGMFYYLCSYDDKARELQSNIRQMGEDRILSCLEPLAEAKKVSVEDLREAARHIQNLMTGTLTNFYNSDYPEKRKEMRDRLMSAVEKLLDI